MVWVWHWVPTQCSIIWRSFLLYCGIAKCCRIENSLVMSPTIQVAGVIFHKKMLHNYFILYHRKYYGQQKKGAVHNGKVECCTLVYTISSILNMPTGTWGINMTASFLSVLGKPYDLFPVKIYGLKFCCI